MRFALIMPDMDGYQGSGVESLHRYNCFYTDYSFTETQHYGFQAKGCSCYGSVCGRSCGDNCFGYMQNHRNTDMARLGGERIFMLSSSYEMWKDHKLSGIGVNSWETYYYSDRYHPEGAQEQHLTMPHNMFIYFLSTAGIIGGLGFIGYTILTLIGLLRLPYENNWLAEWCILVIFIAFLLMACSILLL